MRLDQLHYIIAINNYKSINKAAQQLYISPQALCVALTSLENELGFSLFARTPKGVSLTYHGDRIIKDIEHITNIIDNWKEVMQPEYEAPSEIYISAATVCSSVITKNITSIKNRYPYAIIYLNSLDPRSIFNIQEVNLQGNILVTAIPQQNLSRTLDTLKIKGYQAYKLGNDTPCLIVNQDNALAAKNYIDYTDLYEQEFAVFQPSDEDLAAGKKYIKYFRRGASYIFNDKEQMQKFISKNQAVSIGIHLDRYDNYYFESGKLKMIPFKEAQEEIVYILSFPDKKYKSSAEEYIIECIFHDFLQLKQENLIL